MSLSSDGGAAGPHGGRPPRPDPLALFEEVIELPVGARRARIAELAGGDEPLEAELLALCESDAVEDSLLDRPVLPVRGDAADPAEVAPALADFGPYEILELLGAGGFGQVFLARQRAPIDRRVAIKVIKPGMDSRQVIARFEMERRALARMDHPGIARIIDAGETPEGRPYFAMDWIPGVPITKYCDERRLGLDARLELFLRVCAAVGHAHRKGIIHRDLKPSNVLVADRDGGPVPTVIDFGIARALDRSLLDASLVTQERVFLGTPEYVSPEQTDSGPEMVDTRSDIYSLGAILYELLTGATPLGEALASTSSIERIRRAICESEPQRPSARWTAAGDGEAAAAAAAARSAEAGALARRCRGDLDWVVLRCLEKDPERRYDSVGELADDIERHLSHEPVLAGPPRLAYRARKFFRRNRVAVTAGALVAVALVSGAAFATFGLLEAVRERARADEEARFAESQQRRAEAVRDFFIHGMIEAANPNLGGSADTPVSKVLDEAARRIETEFADAPDIEGSIRATLAVAYRDLGRYAESVDQLDRALALSGVPGAVEPLDAMRLRIHSAQLARLLGDYERAETQLRPIVAECHERFGPEEQVTRMADTELGAALRARSRYDEAESFAARALEATIRATGADSLETAGARVNLALVLRALGRAEEAIELYRLAISAFVAELGPDHARVLIAKNNLGVALDELGREEEAGALYREVWEKRRALLGDAHAYTISSLGNVARTLAAQERYAEAEELCRRSYDALSALLPADHPEILRARRQLADMIRGQGRLDEAEELYRSVLEGQRRTLGDHEEVVHTLERFGRIARARGDRAAAARYFEERLLLSRSVLGPFHPITSNAEEELAEDLSELGRTEELRRLREESIAAARGAARGEEVGAATLGRLAWLLLHAEFDDLRDPAAAAEAARGALERDGADRPELREILGIALLAGGERQGALDQLLVAARGRGVELRADELDSALAPGLSASEAESRYRALIVKARDSAP